MGTFMHWLELSLIHGNMCAVAHVKCPSLHAVPYLMIFCSFFSTHLVPILDDWQSRPSDYPTPESTIHMGSGEVPLVGNSRSPVDVQSCTGTEPSPMVWTTYSSASTGPGHSYQGTVHTILSWLVSHDLPDWTPMQPGGSMCLLPHTSTWQHAWPSVHAQRLFWEIWNEVKYCQTKMKENKIMDNLFCHSYASLYERLCLWWVVIFQRVP